jgi:hypothetical protein
LRSVGETKDILDSEMKKNLHSGNQRRGNRTAEKHKNRKATKRKVGNNPKH